MFSVEYALLKINELQRGRGVCCSLDSRLGILRPSLISGLRPAARLVKHN